MWYHKGHVIDSIEQMPEGAMGFIYKITCIEDGRWYIGKKSLYSNRNVKLGKKELALLEAQKKPGKKPSKKKVTKESDWKKYYGSEATLKDLVKTMGESCFKREIIEYAFKPKQLTYLEIKHQVISDCLTDDKSFNSNILGKFFKKDLVD